MIQHDTLLIAGGSQESRDKLCSVLQGRFNLLEATNTSQMLLLLEQNLNCIAAVLLDVSNWAVIDKGIYNDQQAVSLLKQVPVIVVSDVEAYQDLAIYFRYGASDVMPLNYDPYGMLHRIETVAKVALHRKHLEHIIQEQKEDLRRVSDNMVDALSTIVESRNLESGQHILRIRNFTRILMEEVMRHCPEYGITEQMVAMIASASALHDLGKISIPDGILTKPGPLTPEEREVMRTHTVLGCEALQSLRSTVDPEYLEFAHDICRYHHERWDGKGYPDGLQGEQIPICAQVVGLADCYDALTSSRVYKQVFPHAQAVNMILGGECGAFSLKLLECFKCVNEQFAKLNEEYNDGRDPGKTISDMSLPSSPKRDLSASLLEKTQAKYYCLVHYINAFLMEVQLDTGLFQVIYNPYPELAQLKGVSSLEALTAIAAEQIVIPEERERMYQVIRQELPRFIQQELRRESFYFHHRPYAQEPEGSFEMCFLRIVGMNQRPSLAILCRKLDAPQGLSFQDGSLMSNFTECTYVCRNDNDFTLVRAGRDTYSLGGYTPQEVMDIFGGRLLDMAFPEDRAGIRAEFTRQLKLGSVVRTEYRFICKDGSVGWVVNKSRLVLGEDGQEYIQTFLHDITATKTAYAQLSETLNRYRSILANTENVLFDLDMISGNIDFSETWLDLFGYVPSDDKLYHQFAGQTHVHPDDIPRLMERLSLMRQGSDYEMIEIRIATVEGRYLWCRVRGSAKRDESGKLLRVMGLIVNIDDEKRVQRELEEKANRDSLTGLLNKKAGQQQVERYLSRNQTSRCALLVLDLDNFKEVNDRYGHLFGDALLTQVSQILTDYFHSQDVVARIGGDEFMVMLRGIADRELLANQCTRLKELLLDTFRKDALDQDLGVGCSIGIALCPNDGTSYHSLFSRADQALYQAKAKGKHTFCFYDSTSQLDYRSDSRVTTPIDSDNEVSVLKNDIASQTFHILYQAEDVTAAVNQAMAMIGQQTNVSRVYVFENNDDDTLCDNTFEWCNLGIEPEIQNLQGVSYLTDIPNYQENFNENGLFYCHDVKDLPQGVYEILEPQGIYSMLQCAIRYNGRFKGYIGFDECSKKRLWTKQEIQTLTYFSEILAMFLMRYREQERARKHAARMDAVLEAPGRWTYILDPDTYILKHAQGDHPRASGEAEPGYRCHQVLMDKQEPCENCPVKKLRGEGNAWSVLDFSQDQLLAEAVPIQWRGESCCQVTCRRLPGR